MLTTQLIGCQNTDSQIQGDENSVALAADQVFSPVSSACPEPTANAEEPTANSEPGSLQESSFEINSGTLEGSCETFACHKSPKLGKGVSEGDTVSFRFTAQSDGTTVSGSYTGLVISGEGVHFVPLHGKITGGSTDGSGFDLTGRGESLCQFDRSFSPSPSIFGDCGEGVTVNYREVGILGGEGTLTGDVTCALT